ncbi:MAG: universal stress protein [Acidimicrobiales bacterium]|nr:universal stress protein [Acidimicrobiales bacterium]
MYERIIVGTDGSKTAAQAVERAVQLARMGGGRLTIMTAGRGAKGQAVVDDAKGAHADAGVDIETLVVDADPVSALIDTARRGRYDLVVVGNRGMTGLTRFLGIGAVPNKLSHHLPTSLLVVRTTEFFPPGSPRGSRQTPRG